MELMEETIILTIDQKIRKSHVQEELLLIYEHEEEFWRQRGREQWLLQGDNNTEFFHRCANGQKRKRMMFSLQNGTKLIQGTDDLLAHATSFYKELFGPQQMSSARLAANVWSDEECLNDADRTELDKPFTEEEIKNVIDQMKKNKAAGPDGFPIEFYQSCWDIIKSNLMKVFNDFHLHKIDLNIINYGIITLIPKGDNASTIQKFRPICLLQVLFKIFTKALTVRSEILMLKLIQPCQTAFIRGRYITDGVMLLQEILRETKFRKQQGGILKIDFEKAYDKVNWDFLLDCCKQKGFSENWLIWISKAMAGGTLSVKINDSVGPYFCSHKGVRQGDPFAPSLFNVAVNCLSKMIQMAKQNGLIAGLADHIIQGGCAILQYADDTILFIQDDMESARNLKLLLYIFESMSGLKINFEKSEVPLIQSDDAKLQTYTELFNCQPGSWPIKYLGTPVCARRTTVAEMKFVEEKIKQGMEGWIKKESDLLSQK
jgi:hypothetical protein